VIAVIGAPRLLGSGTDADVAGLAAAIAVAAATAGSRVEFVGKTGDDPAGDAVLLALAHHSVGHVATLRDPSRPTTVLPLENEPADLDAADADPPDPSDLASPGMPPSSGLAGPVLDAADVGLALRYLPELGVIVTVHATAEIVAEAAAASGWSRTVLIVVVEPGTPLPGDLPASAVALAVADDDELGGGAGAAIGRYAAAIDRGEPADAAYQELIATASPVV
jgi:pfkB family carbohydrate kinase